MAEATLKKGWTRVAFGDVVRLCKERSRDPVADGFERYVGLEHLEPGDLKIRRWGNVADGTTFTNVFRAGQILFGKRRAYQRKVGVADFSGVCSGDIYVFEPKNKHFLPDLLPFICQTDSFFEHAIGTSAGSLSPRTNWKSLAVFEFDMPPLDEQRRIASLLEKGAASSSALSVAKERSLSVYRAASAVWFSGILGTGGNGAEQLGAYLSQITDRRHEGLPILSVTIDGQVVRRESLGRHVSDKTGDDKYIRAQPGDIAYNTMRLWQGAIGIVEEQGLISPAYTVMRLRHSELPIEYFWEMLRSPALQREYRRYVRGVASDRWRVYFKDLATIPVLIPDKREAHQQTRALAEIRAASGQLETRAASSAAFLGQLRREFLGS